MSINKGISMKQSFNSKELFAILVLELKIWSDAQLAVVADINEGPRYTMKSNNSDLTTSFDVLTSSEQFFSDFSSENKWGEEEEFGAEAHTEEFLASLAETQKKEVAIKSMVILKTESANVKGLDAEVVNLYAEQKVCVEDAPNAFSNKENEETVVLTLKRLTKNGYWKTVVKDSDESMVEFQLAVNAHDIFDVNDNHVTIKKYGNKTAIEMIMAKYDLDDEYLYSYVDRQSGEMVFKQQRQVLQAKGNFFKAGMVVEGIRLESTVAPHYNTVTFLRDKAVAEADVVEQRPRLVINANGTSSIKMMDVVVIAKGDNYIAKSEPEVEGKLGYYGWDNIVEVASNLVLIPSSVDESNGDAADSEFNEGIMYGTSEATQAMMSDDLTDAAILEMKKEESRSNREAKRVRRKMLTNKEVKNSKDLAILNSAIGEVVKELSDLSYKAVKSRKAVLECHKILAAQSDLEVLKDACEAHKRMFGKCLESDMWKTLNSMIDIQKNKKFAESVESYILENIANINNGSLDIADIDDEMLVEIRLASMKHGWDKQAKKPTAAWIQDPTKSNAIKARFDSIKGLVGAAPAKPKNSSVRKVKVS